jgi:hypothetical protein
MPEVISLEDLFVTAVEMEAEQVVENSNNLCLQNFGEETPKVEAVSSTKNLLLLLCTYFDYFYSQQVLLT